MHRSSWTVALGLVVGLATSVAGCGGASSGADGSAGRGSNGNGTGGWKNGVPNTSSGGGGGRSSTGTNSPAGPGFNGSPGDTGYRPLTPGCGPSTANACTNSCELGTGTSPGTVIRPPATLCFGSADDPTPDDPIAIIEQVIEEIGGKRMVHLRVTFDPGFVDNTYGANAIGWDHGQGTAGATGAGGAANAAGAPGMPGMPGMDPKDKPGMMMPKPMGKSGHTFDDLVGSDHVELLITDGAGTTVMDFKIDYITASKDATVPCGYANMGVTGGEGKIIKGDASAVLGATSSLHRNLNGCGYCLTTDSPATDANYTPNASAPNWDYRVVYEVWIALDAFGANGFGQAYINSVHASPSKLADNTVTVMPDKCPPTWDTPYCPPGTPTGTNCMPTGSCPPNYQLYVQTEGKSVCTPIPFANYPNMAPCPSGYMLDPSTEGRFCIPTK